LTGNTKVQVDRRLTQLHDEFAAVDLRQMQLAIRYTDWIANQIQPHCGPRVLEVGAGIGNISSRLLRHAEYVCALEPNPACFETLGRRLEREPGFECRPWRVEDCDLDFIASRRIDTIVCVNVLEHVDNDLDALKRLRGLLDGPAGRIALVVPAIPAAYGPIDAALGHYRRYSRARLQSVLTQAGFSVTSLHYSNLIGLLGWFFNARITRRVQQSDTQIRIFDRLIVPWSSPMERFFRPPIGLSLVAAAHTER
jgi:2-polyprenyl-3-methyl-5-hydroxy-6-metoxy-1,4-benzoquinol methylase